MYGWYVYVYLYVYEFVVGAIFKAGFYYAGININYEYYWTAGKSKSRIGLDS
jgi:hypothetical protein